MKQPIPDINIRETDPENPWFFAAGVRKNDHFLAGFRRLLDPQSLQTMSTIVKKLDVPTLRTYSDFGLDLAYAAYFTGLINKRLFHNYIYLYSALVSFSGIDCTYNNNRGIPITVPKFPQTEVTVLQLELNDKVLSLQEMLNAASPALKNYLEEIIKTSTDSNYLQFSSEKFFRALSENDSLTIFKLTLSQQDYQLLSTTWPHNIWLNFLSNRIQYPLILFLPDENGVTILFPGSEIISAFIAAIASRAEEEVKVAMGFGIVSLETSQLLHEKGYHFASVLDPRFRNVVELHNRTGNAFEVLMHDTVFHTVKLSSHSLVVRNFFSTYILSALAQFPAEEMILAIKAASIDLNQRVPNALRQKQFLTCVGLLAGILIETTNALVMRQEPQDRDSYRVSVFLACETLFYALISHAHTYFMENPLAIMEVNYVLSEINRAYIDSDNNLLEIMMKRPTDPTFDRELDERQRDAETLERRKQALGQREQILPPQAPQYAFPPAVGPNNPPAVGPNNPPAVGPNNPPAVGPNNPPAVGPNNPYAFLPYPPAAPPSWVPPQNQKKPQSDGNNQRNQFKSGPCIN